MESLKQFRVNFQVTYWCEGRKGIFFKRPYKFTVVFKNDYMNTSFLFNERDVNVAIRKGEELAKKQVQRNLEFMESRRGDFITLTGNIKEDGGFAWSPKVYDITGYEVKFVSATLVQDWSKARVSDAIKTLTVEQFKQVFNEIPNEILT